ncbi:MAG: magnesium transporter [Halobacteriovoraceae bacterium]|nr:magnesium transporter [Halobacteriovoraceae bacterium]|tara:strand:+ start:128972 stop:130306 length:1335 start_codon:yes stop_codon:yes gene_type:complete
MKAIDLKEIFESGHHENVQAYLNFLDPLEIVDLFYLIDAEHYPKVLDNLDNEELADIFPLFEKSLFDEITEILTTDQITQIFNHLETDDAAYLIKMLSDEKRDLVLPRLTKMVQINRILSYPEESAGSIMQTEVCLIREGMSVKEAVDAIRRQKKILGKVVVSYVVDEERKLIGLVQLDDVILSQMSDAISKITKPLKHYVNPEEDQEEVAQIFSKYDLSYLPVVDKEGILLGQIMFDDIQDVIEEEASEDILAYVGVSSDESIGDVNPNRFKLALGRFPWLIFSISASFVTGYILTFFEGNVTNAIIFASFVPLIMNTTGNVGTQTAMIITRSFALGANEFGQFRLPLMREITVGLIMGLMAGLTTFCMILVFYGDSMVGVRVGSTLILSMSTAALFGMLIPIAFKKLGIDPAIASGPLVTSFCDMLSVSMYLGIILGLGELF